MTPEALRETFARLGVELLAENRYQPPSLARHDVSRTPYYRRNRIEFEALARRCGPLLPNGGESSLPGAFPGLEIRFLGGPLGYGLFASEDIEEGGLIGEYAGIVRPARPGRPLPGGGYTSDYAWGFPRVRLFGRSLEIDAREAGGPLRFANHAADPSAYPEHFPWEGRWRIVFLARRDIAAGEEVTVDYGEAYWSGGERELVGGI